MRVDISDLRTPRGLILLCPAPYRAEALSDDVRLTSVCLTSGCRVHRE